MKWKPNKSMTASLTREMKLKGLHAGQKAIMNEILREHASLPTCYFHRMNWDSNMRFFFTSINYTLTRIIKSTSVSVTRHHIGLHISRKRKRNNYNRTRFTQEALSEIQPTEAVLKSSISHTSNPLILMPLIVTRAASPLPGERPVLLS